ncbi:MAG: HAD family hydrolase [Promethearchaeota archaeon]|nr:MAG: HAD family hydrolase [Candidatus Lokiarchaeota archaeon]
MDSDKQLIKRLQNGSIQAIIFDFDGTLLDIREPLRNSIEEIYGEKKIVADIDNTIQEIGALMETIQSYPLPKIILQSHEMFKHITSLQSLTFMKKLEIATKIFSRYLTYAKEAPLYPNTINILKKLKKSFDLFIVSHNQTKNIIEQLEKHKITNLFKGVYGTDVLPALKPDPDSLNPVFKTYKSAKVNNYIMIGDMPSDIEAGNEAGVWTIAVTTGVSKKEILLNFEPNMIIDSLNQLIDITEKRTIEDPNSQESIKAKS